MHQQAYDAVARMAWGAGLTPAFEGRILDMGGRDVNSTSQGIDTRRCFLAASWTGVDIVPGPGVDIVADATRHPWTHGSSYDVALCTELLEHVERWECVIANLAYAVKDSVTQTVIITCAGPGRAPHGMSGEDTPPPGEWYGNITPQELERSLSEYFTHVHVSSGNTSHDTYGYGWAVEHDRKGS